MTKQEFIDTLKKEFVLPSDPHIVDRFGVLLNEYTAPVEVTKNADEFAEEPEGEAVNG